MRKVSTVKIGCGNFSNVIKKFIALLLQMTYFKYNIYQK